MMGIHQAQPEFFSYRVNLEHRVRKDHPLRRVAQVIDFTFVRAEVARFYGRNGHEGVDPILLAKLMFLLFWDDVPRERELMERLTERLDYLWFLGYNLDETTPHHSVLSQARARWGQDVFENIFRRTVQQCVEAGLVDGKKIHVDSSLIDAHASKDSVIQSGPELIAAYKRAIARSPQAPGANKRRRQTLIEGSFAQAANEHGFKRSRWRRLWRQEIQDRLIAAVQNVKIPVRVSGKRLAGGAAAALGAVVRIGSQGGRSEPVWPG